MPVTEYENHFYDIADEMGRKAHLAVNKTVARIHEEVTLALAAPKHGHVYGGHQASAPGEPPANDTGHLTNSVSHRMTGPTEGVVEVGAEYGVYLEMGTSRMAPRPFLGPAVEKVWPEFEAAMEKITG